MLNEIELVRRPLELSAIESFWDEVGDDPETWQWIATTDPIPKTKAELVAAFSKRMDSSDAEFFSFHDSQSGDIVAISAFLDIRPVDRHVEIGSTFVARRFRGGTTNYRMKFLMLQEAFEVRGCVRVTFKVNAINERSRAAMLRIGAKFEGELRNQRQQRDGSWRIAAIYSIIDAEWPEVKADLQAKIAKD